MSIYASIHLGAGHRVNKPVKGRKFVGFAHERAPVKGSCSATEEGRILERLLKRHLEVAWHSL